MHIWILLTTNKITVWYSINVIIIIIIIIINEILTYYQWCDILLITEGKIMVKFTKLFCLVDELTSENKQPLNPRF